MLPTSAEITEMRTAFDEALTQTATIYRATETSDEMGGRTESESSAGTSECRLETAEQRPGMSMIAQRIGDRIGDRDVYMVYFPASTDVQEDDRLLIGSRQFEVLLVLYGGFEISRRAVVVEL